METSVIFYELEQPCMYEDPVLQSIYVVAAEPRVPHQDGQVVPELGPVVDDYIPESPLVGLDMLIESLSTCSSDPFTIELIGTSAVAYGLPLAVE
ncbi:hypothetical protein AHAS_Ahas20G0207200 [Arachis hypogaea]